MRGKNKNKYRSTRGIIDEDDLYSDFYEEETILGIMSPLSRSAPIHSIASHDWKPSAKTLRPRNEKQTQLLEKLKNPNVHIIISSGSAGTGKTFVSVSYAMEQLQAGQINKIVITRPMVAVDDKQFGALPGTVLQKSMPWLMPIVDVMHKYMSPKQVDAMMEKNIIEICPLLYMRGRSFENCLIIADEMQNSSQSQMLMLLTRIGQNSKLIITGDPLQHDRGLETNGLTDIIQRLEKSPQEGMDMVHFTEQEVERHPIIKKVLRLYHAKSVPSV